MKDIKTAEEFRKSFIKVSKPNNMDMILESAYRIDEMMKEYAEYYLKAKIESISDEEIEDTIHKHIPFGVKNRNGKLTNPIKSQKMYTSILKSVTKGVRQLLENKLLNDL